MTEQSTDSLEQVYERFAATLARTEWGSREELDGYRNGLLDKLVTFAYAHSPFYRDRLAPLFEKGDKPDLSRWGEIPILSRSEAEREIDRISPSFVPNELGPVIQVRTSGTTGELFCFRNTYLGRMATACMMNRVYRWNKLDLTKPLASIRTFYLEERSYPSGITMPRWSYPGPPAPHFTIDVRTPIGDLIEWLARRRPVYLLTFPSIAHEMALHPDADRVATIGLELILAISEIVSPDIRSTVRTRFGCEIAQFYGCAEVGSIALQSPIDETCLVCEESVLVEVLDERGKSVGPGETGQVVLTGLYNYATPFIRYQIGDFVTLAPEPCPSGRVLTRISRIEGRARNALRSADGRAVWLSGILTPALLDFLGTPQFQIRQTHLGRLELLLAAHDRTRAPDENRLREYFSDLLGLPVELTLAAVDRLPRSVSGKFERIMSTVST